MKPWMFALAFGRRPQPVTVTFDTNGTLVVPGGVSSVTISGYGARGRNASTTQGHRATTYFNARRRSDGGITSVDGSSSYQSGPAPASYCGPFINSPSDPTYSAIQTCYAFYDASFETPATTGASATGLGKTFPGSYGNTAPATTSFANVPVTGGASYNIVVPTGALITVTYYL